MFLLSTALSAVGLLIHGLQVQILPGALCQLQTRSANGRDADPDGTCSLSCRHPEPAYLAGLRCPCGEWWAALGNVDLPLHRSSRTARAFGKTGTEEMRGSWRATMSCARR